MGLGCAGTCWDMPGCSHFVSYHLLISRVMGVHIPYLFGSLSVAVRDMHGIVFCRKVCNTFSMSGCKDVASAAAGLWSVRRCLSGMIDRRRVH